MRICEREITKDIIKQINAVMEGNPGITRRQLSLKACELLDLRGPGGRYKEVGCRKALLELHRRGTIKLPDNKKVYAFQNRKVKKAGKFELTGVSCSLAGLGEIEIFAVTSRYSKYSAIWNSLLDKYHYLGSGPLCGAQIRYLVRSAEHGWLGALSFSAGTRRLRLRDTWIGWSETASRTHLHEVVCNSRFLILPTVKVPHLASHILSKSLKGLGKDWQEKYGYQPVLAETFVDPRRFKGTCYRAANWTHIGQTASRATPHQNGKVSDGKKDIYMYPLAKGWRKVLCDEPEAGLGKVGRFKDAADWAEAEFGMVKFYDDRLKERLYTLARDFCERPGELVPAACSGSAAKVKAAYRFFRNKGITMDKLLRPHIESTLERIKGQKTVLAVQDTTSLNYTKHGPEHGLGPINKKQDKAVGLLLHGTMAFSEAGTPLGLLAAQCWAREEEDAGKSSKRHELPIEAKESMKWLRSYRVACEVQKACPDTLLVSVGDREADLYELFAEAQQNESGAKLLVRAGKARGRKVKGGDEWQSPGAAAGSGQEDIALWEKMKNEEIKGELEVSLPRGGLRPARKIKLAVRYAEVMLKPPLGKNLPFVKAWVIYAVEREKASGKNEPVEWMLITTVETETFEQACKRIAWYSKRWGIEVYHKTLKSGCRIEDRCLNSVEGLKSCLALDMVVAWRIYWLTKQSRETPDAGCDMILSEDEWKALYVYVKRKPPPESPPTLRDATRMVAALGGFLGRKGDGDPGNITVWRGFQRLADITTGFSLHAVGTSAPLPTTLPHSVKCG